VNGMSIGRELKNMCIVNSGSEGESTALRGQL
jgi:hypothetical protein